MKSLFLFTPFFLLASPIGDLAYPSLLQEGFWIPDTASQNLHLQILGDLLLSKSFQGRKNSSSSQDPRLEGTSFVGSLAWVLFERLSLELGAGSGTFSWKLKQNQNSFSGTLSEGLLLNGNGKIIFLEIRDTTFSVGGEIGGWQWMKGKASLNGSALLEKAHSSMKYWQVDAALIQKITPFFPYIGIVVNRSWLKIQQSQMETAHLKEEHQLGFFGGCSLTNGSKFLLNLEWRCFFETGISLSGRFRF